MRYEEILNKIAEDKAEAAEYSARLRTCKTSFFCELWAFLKGRRTYQDLVFFKDTTIELYIVDGFDGETFGGELLTTRGGLKHLSGLDKLVTWDGYVVNLSKCVRLTPHTYKVFRTKLKKINQ